jgi:hypothetical protein
MTPDDCIAQAVREYQERTWNADDFADLSTEVQRSILHRACQIQEDGDRMDESMAA